MISLPPSRRWTAPALALLLGLSAACSQTKTDGTAAAPGATSETPAAGAGDNGAAPANSPLQVVTEIAEPQMVALAVTGDGRKFGTFPRWDHNPVNPVAEFSADGRSVKPYPNASWCTWNDSVKTDPQHHWICPQAIIVDKTGLLWVLDPAAPGMKFIVAGGPKLVCIDPKTNQVVKNISFGPDLAPAKSYLNDVRIDTDKQIAYLTESSQGGIIVMDLKTQKGRRLLTKHPSVKAEKGLILKASGTHEMIDAKGKPMMVNSDGIALSRDGQYLYYQPITAHHLYRIKTEALRNPALSEAQLGQQVENLGEVPATDGLEIDAQNNVYFTAFEQDALVRRSPDGKLTTLVKEDRLLWPDTYAWGADNTLYVTASAIQNGPTWNKGVGLPGTMYRTFKMKLP
ncbi:SMP-30/gluconolactonase/LRE family protein [uncultured Hymenobacter sp.]|uniref:SMP-30/gluconolactonase/LRE family protein n=1 Tax=uncultured Hymenobacter sp. TaxID=170016 RepID=UPI0035CA8086